MSETIRTATGLPPMGFAGSVKRCLRRYVGFRGRATRAEHGWFVLFAILLNVGAYILLTLMSLLALSITEYPGVRGALQVLDRFAGAVLLLLDLAILPPLVAAGVRRYHDVGLSGWWYALGIVVLLFGAFQNPSGPAAFLAMPLMLLGLGAIVIVACLPGRGGPNRYGVGSPTAITEVFGGDAGGTAPEQP